MKRKQFIGGIALVLNKIMPDKIQVPFLARKYDSFETTYMTISSNYWYLSNHHIFSQLTPNELKDLSVQVGLIKVKKHQEVNLLKDNIQRIYFLKKGLLKIIKKEGKGESVIDLIHEEDVFGQLTSHNSNCSSTEFVSVLSEEAIICTFTKENFEKVLSANPAICLSYSKKIGDRYLRLQQKYSDLIFKDVKTRLFEFLKEYTRIYGIQGEDSMSCRNILTHQDIADLIGCERQTVSILLKELKSKNQIDYSREEIKVYNG